MTVHGNNTEHRDPAIISKDHFLTLYPYLVPVLESLANCSQECKFTASSCFLLLQGPVSIHRKSDSGVKISTSTIEKSNIPKTVQVPGTSKITSI